MGLFGIGGKKKEDTLEGEMSPTMVNMLAGMPGMMRKPMMRGRINALLTYTEERRQETITGMFQSFHSAKVKDKNRDKVIATRIEIVGDLPEDKRRTLMLSRVAALKKNPDLEAKDQKVQDKVMSQVPAKARQAFQETWNAVHKSSPN